MIKNFTLITQSVKNGFDGVLTREKYFLSSNHPNHSKTEEILDVIGSSKTSQSIAINGERYRLHQKVRDNRRGRPISSYAMEYCLTLPKGYRPSKEQWRAIVKDCVCSLASHLRLSEGDKTLFYKQVRAVCHRQNQQGLGAGDHVHLLIGKVINNVVLTELQRKSSTTTIKAAFNQAVAVHLSLRVEDYKPYEVNRGKKLEKWAYVLKERKRLEARLDKQIEKWNQAKDSGDIKQLKRQRNRINKTLDELRGRPSLE
ncbi:hypothetical protein AB4086_17335 [Vibrio splendidus]|uniref:hypothetical protein n=1 Tax=Vibrio atlanticus TaxID=693153 RepID=UPI00354F83DE